MAATLQTRPEKLLVQWRRGPNGALVASIAFYEIEEKVEGDVITPLGLALPADIDLAAVEPIIGATLPALVAGLATAEAALVEAQAAVATLTSQAEDQAAEKAALQARIDELTAPPAEPVVSKMQAVLALEDTPSSGYAGLTMLDVVEMQIEQASRRTQLYWKNTSHLHRNHPELLAMAAELGMTPEFVDGLFALAATKS